MPTYDYHCKACDCRLEIFQSIKARPIKKCPKCNENTLERLIGSGSGIIFRGSGFYETDYRSSSYKAQASKESSSASASDTTDDNSKPKTGDTSKEKGSTKSTGKKETAKSGKMKAAG